MNVSKINEGSSVVLLQMDPVFLYKIPNKSVEHVHRASDWNISAPDWYGKLLVTETDSDSCQVQFKNTNGMFGVATITKRKFSSSQVLQKVKDSSRYCTVQIQNIVSGDSAVYGIGFMDRKDMSILFRCLQDYFGSQNECLVAEDNFLKYADHAQVKPDVADGFTKEMKYNDHKKVEGDVNNEATKDVEYTGLEPIKLDVKDEITKDMKYIAHAAIKNDVKDEITKDVKYAGHAPIKKDVKDETTKDIKYTAHAPIKVDVEDEITKDVKYTAHAPIKVDVKDEISEDVKFTGHAPIKNDVKDEITKDVKYAGHAPIKVDIKNETTKDVKYTAHAPIKTDVKDEITNDVKCAGHAPIALDIKELRYAGHPENNVEVDIKDGITKDSKCNGRTSVEVSVSCNLHEPTKVKKDVKIGQLNEIKYSESEKIKLDTKMDVTKKNVTHQNTLQLKVNIKDAKKRKLQRDSESDEDQIEVNKSTSNIVTEELDEVMDPQSDINDNGFLYQDTVTKSFTCHLCPYTSEFRSKMNFLLIHWASKHKIKKPNTCKLCNLVFLTPEIRAKHIISRHEKMCSLCAMEFDTTSKLRSHVKNLHAPNVNNHNNINHPEPEPASTQAKHDQDVNNKNNIKCPDPVSVPAIHESRVAPITPTVLKPPTSVQEEITEEGIPYYDRDAKLFMCHFCPLLTFPPTNQLTFLFQHWKEVHSINEPHTCELCYLNFLKAAHRLKHVTTLHQVCSICSKEFGRLTDLTKHVSVHHWNVSNPSISVIEPKKAIRIHTCTICLKQFETERYLRFHCEAHHSSGTEQTAENCLVDGEENSAKEQASTISKKRKLQSESQSDEDQVVVKKGTSNIVTEEQDGVKDPHSDITDNGHLYKDSVTNSFACHLCPYTCKIQSKVNFLLSHWASSHKIKKPIICKLCNLVFPTPEIRTTHIISRHDKMCSFCEMEFATKMKLQSHIKDLHALNVNNYNNMKKPEPKPTSIQAVQNQGVNNGNNINCPDPVSVPAILAIHESRVAPLITPTVYKTPMFVHGEETETGMSYQCPRTHRFICILCPLLKFPSNRKLAFLYQHWKEVHYVIEPHTCQLCCLNFSTAAHRLKHVMELHEVCPICSKEFGNLPNLHKHSWVHQWNAPNPSISVELKKSKLIYTCSVCSKQFETEQHLRFHCEAHHSSTTEQPAIRNVLNPSTTVEPKRPTLSYKCMICSLEFANELSLQFHSEVHGWKIA